MHTWLTNQITLALKYKQKNGLLNISLFAVDNDYGVLSYGVCMISTQKIYDFTQGSLLAPNNIPYPVVVIEENPSLYNPHPYPSLLPIHIHKIFCFLLNSKLRFPILFSAP